MAKKTAKKKVAKKKVVRKVAPSRGNLNRIQDYAHEIWLAGLGAFAMAQDEGGRVIERGGKLINEKTGKVVREGTRLFDYLVSEGRRLESKGRKLAGQAVGNVKTAVGDVRSDVEGRMGKARDTARSNWDKLEKVFEDRVARSLAALGVPTSDEIAELGKRVQELNARVRELSTRSAAAPKVAVKTSKPAKKKLAKKTAAKKTASKKAVAKPADPPVG